MQGNNPNGRPQQPYRGQQPQYNGQQQPQYRPQQYQQPMLLLILMLQ